MSTGTTDTEMDEESVNLVPLPPSPNLDPAHAMDTNVSTPTALAVISNEPKQAIPSTIPTPKSRSSTDTSPPPIPGAFLAATRMSRRGASGDNPQAQDSCMFCTPATAPPGANLDWIQCNGCKRWSHTQCTGLPSETDVSTIDKFHCKRCEKTRGPTTCTPIIRPG
jgi:hypothetical protein